MGKEARSGTLMWVGPRDTKELRPIFQFCEENVSQIAVRRNLHDARRRDSDNVRCIILARHDRSRIDYSVVDKLTAQHPYANTVELLGALATQQTTSAKAPIARIYWHRWNQSIRSLLTCCGVAETESFARAHSVAVVAQTISDADPLMDIAVANGAAAVWCRRPDAVFARNFDVVWWDDSVATPTDETLWGRRMKSVRRTTGIPQTHVWMTNIPHADDIEAAQRAGVDVVLSKPVKLESLLATIGAHDRRTPAATGAPVGHNRSQAA